MVRYNFIFDDETDEKLDRLAADGKTTRSAILRKLVADATAAMEERQAYQRYQRQARSDVAELIGVPA